MTRVVAAILAPLIVVPLALLCAPFAGVIAERGRRLGIVASRSH